MKKHKEKHRKKRQGMNPVMFLASLLVFAAGAGIFLYPAVSNKLAEKNQKKIITAYAKYVDETDEEELERQWAQAEEYNDNLAGDPLHDPFVPGSGYALPDNYTSVLNVGGDGVMGNVEIPKIHVNLPIYHGTSEEVLEKGAGHLESTSLPIGGLYRHSVISAHRGLSSAELFTRLDELEPGDVFYIHVLDQTLAYEVDQIKVIEPEELTFLQSERDKDLVTLLTCTPYAVNTHRLLVRGSRIPYEKGTDTGTVFGPDGTASAKKGEWREIYERAVLFGIILILVILLLPAVIKGIHAGKKDSKKKDSKKKRKLR